MLRYYYPKTIKNVTVALMDLFNDLTVYKYTSAGTSADVYTVPISFGPVEKEHQNRIEDHEYIASATDSNGYKQVEAHGQRYWISTPRMALTMNGIAYNAERAAGVNSWREWFVESLSLTGSHVDEILRDYQPSPYDISFTLYIMTDSMDYFSQIMENILPYFNPALFLRVKEFSFLNIERNLKVTMNGVNPEFISPEISDDERRYVNATIDLVVESWMYRPFEYGKIINVIDTKYFVDDDITPTVSATYTSAGIYISASNCELDVYFSTSGVNLTSAGEMTPISAIPSVGSYFTSGHFYDDIKDFNWFKENKYITSAI